MSHSDLCERDPAHLPEEPMYFVLPLPKEARLRNTHQYDEHPDPTRHGIVTLSIKDFSDFNIEHRLILDSQELSDLVERFGVRYRQKGSRG